MTGLFFGVLELVAACLALLPFVLLIRAGRMTGALVEREREEMNIW